MRQRFTEEQIIGILKQSEAGTKTGELCRQHGMSDAASYKWKAKYSGLEVSDLRKLKVLEEENRKLKAIVADLSLDNRALKDVLSKKFTLTSVSRTVMHYTRLPNDLNDRLRLRLKELAEKHRRYGHIRLYVLIRREGLIVNHKRTERIYRSEGLSLRIRRRKKFAAMVRNPLPPATRPNERWAMDFISDSLWSGRKFRTLSIVDTYARECMTVEADTSLPGYRVVIILDRLADQRGLPDSIRIDNGPEFISKVLDEWAYRNGVKLDFIRPGKPVENAYVESFYGRFRDEFLNQNYFLNMQEAKNKIEEWRIEYNTFRPTAH